MNRRNFIYGVMVSGTALILPPFLTSCSNSTIDLSDRIGSSSDSLEKYPMQGNNLFSFFTLQEGEFEHLNILGTRAFIYSVNRQVVGFTILCNDLNGLKNWQTKLTSDFGTPSKRYENDYGKSEQWAVDNKAVIISKSGNAEIKLKPRYRYSEILNPHLHLIVA